MRVIDLAGPQGNAYYLLGTAASVAKQLGLDPTPIRADMMSGDYEHLLTIFEKHFGNIFELVNKPGQEDELEIDGWE